LTADVAAGDQAGDPRSGGASAPVAPEDLQKVVEAAKAALTAGR
jgi:hypothetical protein